MIRSSNIHRRIAWLAILAMAFVAFAPTISRLRAVIAGERNPHMRAGMQHGSPGDPSGDCWSKCGYCDFLARAPVIGSVDYLALQLSFGNSCLAYFNAAIAAAPAAFAQAAQPRGPPAFA